jgi:hypothetical protein
MVSEDTRFEVLHAHYVDTFGHIRHALGQRDRLFAYIVVAIALMLLRVVAPEETDAAIGGLIAQSLALAATVSLTLIGTALWFVLLALVIRYFQTVIYIERQYDYIHALENLLAPNYEGGTAFTREGKSYLSDYPLFSKWTWALYTIVFPVLLIVVLGVKIIAELRRAINFSWLLVFDALTFVAISVSVVLYLVSLHRKK